YYLVLFGVKFSRFAKIYGINTSNIDDRKNDNE
ncbi:unnamed protein product, partial [Onchocerca ochengi]|uniref:Replication protein n=1 Tax=Onchocerca ochengi TaxID=42157 RepID=A0A182EC98_ONCOC